MPRPDSVSSIIRPELGAIAYEYMMEQSQQGFIGLSLLPVFETVLQAGQYPKIPLEAILKVKDGTRSPRGNYDRDDYKFEMGNYSCQDRGFEERLDDTERAMYATLFDAEVVAVQRAVNKVLRSQELRIAAKLFNTSNLSYTNISTEWSTAASATPLANVVAGKNSMRASSGLLPNKIAMGWTAFNNVLLTAEIKDALKYTSPIELGGLENQRRMLASYFGVSEILVGGAVKDTAGKGKATSIADIWDDEYVLLARVAENVKDLKEPALGRTFLWIEDSPDILVTESYREEQTRSDIYRVRHNVAEEFVFAGAGYLLGNITA